MIYKCVSILFLFFFIFFLFVFPAPLESYLPIGQGLAQGRRDSENEANSRRNSA